MPLAGLCSFITLTWIWNILRHHLSYKSNLWLLLYIYVILNVKSHTRNWLSQVLVLSVFGNLCEKKMFEFMCKLVIPTNSLANFPTVSVSSNESWVCPDVTFIPVSMAVKGHLIYAEFSCNTLLVWLLSDILNQSRTDLRETPGFCFHLETVNNETVAHTLLFIAHI